VAITTDGAVAYWGDAQTTPPAKFIEIGAEAPYQGGSHYCALTDYQALTCWGATGNLTHASPPPGAFKALSAGSNFFCGLTVAGDVKCWDTVGPAGKPPAGTFTDVAAGLDNTCAVTSSGTLSCWGSSLYGVQSPPSGNFSSVALSNHDACALRSDSAMVCWGANYDDPSDSATNIDPGPFKNVSVACGVMTNGELRCKSFKAARPGKYTSVTNDCAIRTNGRVECFGRLLRPAQD
jgi:hypothetical protein